MFNLEFDGDLYRLLHAYPVVFGHMQYVDQMNRDLLLAFDSASRHTPDFSDLSSLLRTSWRAKDLVPRKAAWIAQQVLGSKTGRSIAVNQRILKDKTRAQNGGSVRSPLVDQLSLRFGVSRAEWTKEIDPEVLVFATESCKIDTLVVDHSTNTIYTIKAVGASQVRKVSRSLQLGHKHLSLFACTNKPLGNAMIPLRCGKIAVAAAKVVSTAYPDFSVVPAVMVVDETDGSWFYQIDRVAESCWMQSVERNALLCLDDLDPLASTFTHHGDEVNLSRIDAGPDFLDVLPVDRVLRPLMFLDCLAEAQFANGSHLVAMTPRDLRDCVRGRFGIGFDRDMRRHDLEDSLLASNWAGSASRFSPKFYITPAGVGLLAIIRQSFIGESESLGPSAVGLVQRQAKLEISHRFKMAR